MALAHAPLLSDLADDWVLEARDHYRERVAVVALRLADAREAAGQLREAVAWTRRALAHAPLRESVHRALMRRLAAMGERAEALAAYERCRAVLTAEFRTSPSEATRALATRLRAGDGPVAPAPLGSQAATGPVSQVPTSRRAVPLVGRKPELAALGAAWERARRGHGGVVVVSGAAGLGKTRLAAELVARVAGEDGRGAVGTAFELAGAPPFGPWTAAIHELVAQTPAPPQDAVWPTDLARLCRSVERRWARAASSASPHPEQERSWLFEAVTETLAWCSRDRPLVLVLEDVHRADHASIALLAFVGRRLTSLPVLLVATRRPATARQDLVIALDALARRHALGDEIVLAPLATPELAAIVHACAPGLPDDMAVRAVDAAEGNPLLAREAARAAVTGGDPSQGLRDWVRAPLARLPGSARLLVDVVAAAGRPIGPGQAADLVGAHRLAEALDAGCREELLDATGPRIRFTHTLVREACYAELEPARRVWLHTRLAEVLDAAPDRSVAEIARHLLLAGHAERARSYLVGAAEQARTLGAFEEAASFLREAASAATDAPGLAAELWLALAEAEAWRSSREDHDTAFSRALVLLEASGDAAAIAAAYVMHGRCLRTTLCFPRDALAAYQRALEVIDERGLDTPELRVLALAGSAWVQAASGDVTRAQELVAEAEALPDVVDDLVLAAEISLARAAALMRQGNFEGSEQAAERAAELAGRGGRIELAAVGLLQAAASAAYRGDFSRAHELADQVRCSWAGTSLAIEALAVCAYTLARLGRHAEAWSAIREELVLVVRIGATSQESAATFDAGSIALETGRYGEAIERLATVLADRAEGVPLALARLRLAEARLRAGDAEAASEELALLPFEPVGPTDLPETLVLRAERLEGLVAAALGQDSLALRRLAAAEAGWRRLLAATPSGCCYAAARADLGTAPVGGLVEPGAELGRVLAERAQLLAEKGCLAEARHAAVEAAALADLLAVDSYRAILQAVEKTISGTIDLTVV